MAQCLLFGIAVFGLTRCQARLETLHVSCGPNVVSSTLRECSRNGKIVVFKISGLLTQFSYTEKCSFGGLLGVVS